MLNHFGFNMNFAELKSGASALTTSDDLKAYFSKIMELSKSGEKFPVDLDEVWPLVYGRKEEAVRALNSNNLFLKDIDYQFLRKNAEQDFENKWGGNNRVTYKLSVQCLEYFIVRKNRSVFEVYRQIFHAVVQGKFSQPRKTSKGVPRLPYSEIPKKICVNSLLPTTVIFSLAIK